MLLAGVKSSCSDYWDHTFPVNRSMRSSTVSFDTARKSRELTVQLEKASSAIKNNVSTFIINFVVKNWMKGKQDHVVNWIACIKSKSEKQTKSLGALDLLEREANGFIYKDEILCKIYILQTENLHYYQYESKSRLP